MNKKMLGQRINSARKERGLTSEQLAEQCYISAAYLRQIESGKKVPSLPLFISLCNELNVSPNYLLQDLLSHSDLDSIPELLDAASPQQKELILSVVQTALEYLSHNT